MRIKVPKFIAIAVCAIVLLLGLFFLWKLSPTKIATFNYPDFTVEKMLRSNNNPFVKITQLDMTKAKRMKNYDVVLVRVHGSSLTEEHLLLIKKAIRSSVCVIATESDNSEINSLSGDNLKYVTTLMENSSVKNYRSLFNFLRKKIDKKLVSNKEYFEPIIVPNDYYFHIGDDKFFSNYQDYLNYYKEIGLYKESAPNIVMLTGNINLQNSNEEHIVALILSLEKRGFNVFPISSFGPKKLQLIKNVEPDIIIYTPHGRFLMGGAAAGENLLKELNVPIFAPIVLSEKYENWVKSAQGMTAGGMTSMSVVLPELDGAIAPFAVSAQFERGGKLLFDKIPKHTEKFTSLVSNFAKLQHKKNKDKHIAIYYYKGVGKGTISASDIEAVSSLCNTLKTLKKKGYNVEGLPADVKEFENMIQRQGSVLGTYALGAYDRFINEGNPALVSKNNFYTWAKAQFPDSLINDIELKYGQFPGDYMSVSKNAEKLLSVARIEFGNVAILPQPMASTGEDIEKIVHGVNGAPAYPYIASYLWTKYEFKADAIVHFGTHGSLEFIPGKQIALSDYDWSDAIIGDMPHFYVYTINNIGEGIIAKRRSYATLISHLTAPFFRSELYDDLAKIKNMVHKMDNMGEGPLRQSYRESITKLASSENITSALGLDTTRVLNDEEIEQIHIYLEEIEGAKVSDGLYTLGIPYTKKEIENTTRLMSLDPIRYSLANLDLSRGKISQKEIENIAFLSHNYDKKGEDIIRKSMKSLDPYSIFQDLLTSEELLIMQKDSLSPVLESINTLKETILNVAITKKNLENSTSYEENALIDALSGRYVQPSSAGDPIINPRAIPTGKNFYSINPEVTPTPQAWKVGEKLAKSLLESELKNAGAYPQKVSFTLWSTDFISSEGATIAQILYLLGVEPIRDGFGYIRSLKLIPSQELGRPRIDVVVQTSGQLRDIAASRLKLINDAVLMAAADSSSNNNVAKGFKDAEALLLLKGFSLLEARTYAQQRVFGGVGGNYGTGIMGMVEKSDSWEDRAEIGEKYLFNMGAMYSSNGDDSWGEYKEGVFEAALLNTSVVVQPRSSNTWGPLSLDHVYEFMGGLSSAVENVTGVDPRAYFNDFRNPANARTQGLKEAIGVETNSTVFNPKYIKKMMTEGPSAMAHFSETFKNTFGWNTMKPSAIDQHIWNKYYEVYVEDVYNLGVKRAFEESNPYALEEMTAVMLEAVRKDMWKASEKQIKEVSKLHSQLLSDYDAACSGFVCDNAKLREFISSKLPMDKAKEYNQKISQERQLQIKSNAAEKNVVLKKESKTKKENAKIDQKSLEPEENPVLNTLLILSVAILVLVSLWIFSKRLKDKK